MLKSRDSHLAGREKKHTICLFCLVFSPWFQDIPTTTMTQPHLVEHLREGREAAQAPKRRTFGVSNWRGSRIHEGDLSRQLMARGY